MKQEKKPASGPVRHFSPSEIGRFGEKCQPKDPIPCTGNVIIIPFGEGTRQISDHEILDILRKDREATGSDRLTAKQRGALVALRIKLSQEGTASFSPDETVRLYWLVAPKERQDMEPDERERRNAQVRAFFAFYKSERGCDVGILNDFFTSELIETLVKASSEVLKPYGFGEEKARIFVYECGRHFLECCYRYMGNMFETGEVTNRTMARALFGRCLNPDSNSYFFKDVCFGQEKHAGFSEIPDLLRHELKDVPHTASEVVADRMASIIGPASVRTVSGGAPGSGQGGSPGHK
jgi:hypothetical protein